MTLRAKPQLNGNSRDDFERAYVTIGDAMYAIQKVRAIMLGDVANARNYQHLGHGGTDTAIEDRRSVDANLGLALNLLGTIASEIVDAIEA
jgi:hypothetical protein